MSKNGINDVRLNLSQEAYRALSEKEFETIFKQIGWSSRRCLRVFEGWPRPATIEDIKEHLKLLFEKRDGDGEEYKAAAQPHIVGGPVSCDQCGAKFQPRSRNKLDRETGKPRFTAEGEPIVKSNFTILPVLFEGRVESFEAVSLCNVCLDFSLDGDRNLIMFPDRETAEISAERENNRRMARERAQKAREDRGGREHDGYQRIGGRQHGHGKK